MRLIDADAFIDNVFECSVYDKEDIENMIDNEPTAYDVDKVIEELEKCGLFIAMDSAGLTKCIIRRGGIERG